MERWIDHVCEPERLLLVWEAPLHVPDRTRWVVGELSNAGGNIQFRYYKDASEFESINGGRTLSDLRSAGYAGYPTFKIDVDIDTVRRQAISAFLRRIPSRSRADFGKYLGHFRIANSEISDMALLGLTMAKLPSDGFSLVNPLDVRQVECDFIIEIAGNRHYADACTGLAVDEILGFERETSNPFDPNAVAVLRKNGAKIGNVARVQAPAFSGWLQDACGIEGQIIRLNGASDRPRIYVLVQVRQPKTQAAAA